MQLISKYFPDLSPEQIRQFSMLEALYADWNEKINVISRKDMEHLYERHILHSLAIAKVIQFKAGTEILDIGTGGGFPGIPLAIMFPDSNFYLVDSIGKKIKVVKAVAESIGLSNVKGEQIRAEEVDQQFDFIVSRAVTQTGPFLHWVKGKILKNSFHSIHNGLLLLKGGDLKEELAEVKKHFRLYNLSDYFSEEFFETKKVLYIPA
jgi:16S rRNA (guanine527-N7)-methyltransferase